MIRPCIISALVKFRFVRLSTRAALLVAISACCLGASDSATPKADNDKSDWYLPVEVLEAITLDAERGDDSAQYLLGYMYKDGLAGEPNPQEAAKWFHLAADQGDQMAQSYLGRMYSRGNGVERDDVNAYLWLSLASSGNGQNSDTKTRDDLAKFMTDSQIAKAKKLVSEWRQQRVNK